MSKHFKSLKNAEMYVLYDYIKLVINEKNGG